ncbi:MAG TPA: asparagine synthase (glutamine-hydrolyzing) [Candidatus Sulfotelmatobacter sp.]|jgi:asparagine synthase (glutamine-hydrolysing)|nr:asparagine synthase (glutamine-hydrolyzing) [Candidatus Sulfotelmatobacter sp.]
MCGIVGIIGLKAEVPADLLERATQSLAHRGPDDGGSVILHDATHEEIEIGLGNRRLAILDLSPLGHQPMNDPDTGNWIVYNGEIYNFREVRTRLEQAGLLFKSVSDTEVILKAYAHWGEKCLLEFRGMFAFAIWDARRRLLFVARDPMGIKPLYYCESGRYFIFSSEVRTLLGTGLIPRVIDPAGLINYLAFGSVYDPNTLVDGVSALPPGHSLTWKEGKLALSKYWDLTDPGETDRSDETRAGSEEQVVAMLDECVRMQMVSDVPVGVFLSGGIDSSSLVGILGRNGLHISTFSIVFREAEYSEAEYSREIAKQFHTDHHEITVSQSDLFAAIDPAIHAMDQPTIDGINTYFVSEKTRAAGVKVALSGLGGDEVFAGYSSFRTVPRMERFAHAWKQVPAVVRTPLAILFAALAPANDQNRKLTALARNGGAIVNPYFLSRMLFTPEQQAELLQSTTKNSAASSRAQEPLINSVSRAQGLDLVNRVSYLEARCYMLNTLLRDSDFMSMAHGLEVRVPLIDHQLARRVLALPGRWKLDARTPKPLLVKALTGQLPDNIVHRPKRGFTLPFEHWLRDALRPVVEESLRKIGDGALGSLISERAARGVWEEFLAGRTSWSRPWSLYVLHRWCQEHLSS